MSTDTTGLAGADMGATVGPASSSNGYLTAEQAQDNAPRDLAEDDVEDVFGGKVRIRALTAAQVAAVKNASVNTQGRNPTVQWAELERKQFEFGVVIPRFTAQQVRDLHATSGPSFAKVVREIDRLSGTDIEALRDATARFQGSDNGA